MDTFVNDASTANSAISLQIQWNRLISIMDEADVALLHSAFSTIVSDSRDYAVILLDKHARSIAQAQICVPAFTCSLPSAARTMLKKFPADTLKPGDVLFTNDPWICHGHLPDFYVIKPLFAEGELVAYYAAAAHISDIGGRLDELIARDVYEEGLRLPPCKLYEGGKPNEAILNILEANTRYPRLVLGDLGAMIGASNIVEERCQEFLKDYGAKAIEDVAEQILTRSEAAMRTAIEALPDGDYFYDIECDGFIVPTLIKLKLTVAGQELTLDYGGSSPQRANASVNCVLNVTHAHSMFAVKCSLVPDIPNNEGLFRPVKTVAEEGSILNARFPAPVRARSMTSFHLHNAIFGALSDVLPDRVQAGSGSFWWMTCAGRDADNTPYAVHVLPNGGTGAIRGGDGFPTMAFPGNGTITPIEIIENKAPIIVTERSLWQDSGGPGEFRGGLGQIIRLRPSEGPARLTLRPDKVFFPPPALAGGEPGAKGQFLVDDKPLPIEPFALEEGQELTLKIPGGGGYGSPAARDRESVRRDLQDGYISEAAAREFYGYAPTTNVQD
jgi:N-methylhydantoinase B